VTDAFPFGAAAPHSWSSVVVVATRALIGTRSCACLRPVPTRQSRAWRAAGLLRKKDQVARTGHSGVCPITCACD
jgi:hypothetical protein